MQREVLCEDAVRYAIAKFKAELVDRLENARSHLAVLREEKERLKTEIGNLASVIAAGRYSPALLAELEKRERRIGEIGDELLATDERGIDAHFKEIETFVLNGLGDVQGRLTGEIPRAKAELAKHCAEITLTPESKDGETVAVVAYAERKNKYMIWTYKVGERNATVVEGTDDASNPFWSPDGEWIGFFSQGKLKKVDAQGTSVMVLADAPNGRGGAWNNDGVILFTPDVFTGVCTPPLPPPTD